jgi:hypothetical protein
MHWINWVTVVVILVVVVREPNATSATTGLPTAPGRGPWLMFPGTPKAHMMLTPDT